MNGGLDAAIGVSFGDRDIRDFWSALNEGLRAKLGIN